MTTMLQRSIQLAFFLFLAAVLPEMAESRNLNFKAIWFKRPYNGPQCVVEVIGADLNSASNSRFDYFTKPDIIVSCSHAQWERKTQIEGNTFKPRFLWQAKMPFKSEKGFAFTVYDVDVLNDDQVIGRAFIGAKKARELMRKKESILLNLGDGIGVLKVKISHLPKDLGYRKIPFGSRPAPLADAANAAALTK